MAIGVSNRKMNQLRWLNHELGKGHCPDMDRLAGGLQVSRKTVQRLMDNLRDYFGAEIGYDRLRCGYHYLRQPRELENAFGGVQLSEADRLNIGLGVKALEFLSLSKAADGLRLWISQVSGENLAVPMADLDRVFSLAEIRRALVVKEELRELLFAIQQRCVVEFKYSAAYNSTTALRQVDPYHLTYRDAAWYLIGYAHDRAQIRTFSLSRMGGIRLLRDRHFADPGFDPGQHFRDAGIIQNGERCVVQLRFSGPAIERVEERDYQFDFIDPQHTYRRDAEGRLHLEFRHSYLEALVPMLLSFGKDVEVLAPKELRVMLRTELVAALERHTE